MTRVNVFGVYDFKNKKTYNPERKCVNCPLSCDTWCNYLRIRIPDPEYYSDCPVIQIIVEE
jgi:hypothetical protein